MSSSEGFRRLLHEPRNKPVFRKFLLTTLAMLLLPLVVFFGVRNMGPQLLGLEESRVNLWAAAAAVVVVNLLMGTYVYIAWAENVGDDVKIVLQKKDE
jgi:hypothetical protein